MGSIRRCHWRQFLTVFFMISFLTIWSLILADQQSFVANLLPTTQGTILWELNNSPSRTAKHFANNKVKIRIKKTNYDQITYFLFKKICLTSMTVYGKQRTSRTQKICNNSEVAFGAGFQKFDGKKKAKILCRRPFNVLIMYKTRQLFIKMFSQLQGKIHTYERKSLSKSF